MRSMSMYNLPIYLIFLALLEALCWWMGAWFFAALFLALYAVFAVVSLRNDLILRYDGVVVVSRGKPYPLEWEDVERVARAYRCLLYTSSNPISYVTSTPAGTT